MSCALQHAFHHANLYLNGLQIRLQPVLISVASEFLSDFFYYSFGFYFYSFVYNSTTLNNCVLYVGNLRQILGSQNSQ